MEAIRVSGGVARSPHEALRADLLKSRRRTAPEKPNAEPPLAAKSAKRRQQDHVSASPSPSKRQKSGAPADSAAESGHVAKNRAPVVKKGHHDGEASEKVREKRERPKKKPDAKAAKSSSGPERHLVRKAGVPGGKIPGGKAPAAAEKPRAPGVLSKMRARLQGGHFRMLNEALYTLRGEEAFGMFQKSPDSFRLYHAGYEKQTSKWPQLPLDAILNWLKTQNPNLVVADFGCGEATLAARAPNPVISLDLVASHPHVISCNMAKTPLDSVSVDCAVFCLSLMGVDYSAYLLEAQRVLKLK